MNSQGRAKAIFLGALEIASEEQRRAFVEEQCGGDEELRAEVEELLRHHQHVGSFLQTPALESGRTQSLDPSSTSQPSGDAAPERTEVEPVEAAQDVALDFLSASSDPGHLGQLGPYEITEVVGRGGMGVVLKGNDPKLQRVLAIKVLAPELASNATARKRFLREAQAAAAVAHPHVVTIYAVDDGQPPYLVMEFVNGESLQAKIDREGQLQLVEVLRIGVQLASGLTAAHAQGLIHRDIKPANILLENGVERVRITDFGLARAVDDVGVTKTGEVTGTPQYMSPEQAQGQAMDSRSDLFNLGCVLYAMCTGRSPFRAETTVAAIRCVCDDTPRPIREINAEVPGWLQAIVDRLLAKDRDERFETAAEVADLLGRYLAHVQDPVNMPRPDTVHFPFHRRSDGSVLGRLLGGRAWLTAAAAVGALVVGFGVTEAIGVTELAETMVRIVTGEGTLVVKVSDPRVQVSLDGEELSIKGTGVEEFKLRPGRYRFQAIRGRERVKTEVVTITRGGREVVTVSLEGQQPEAAITATEIPLRGHALVTFLKLAGARVETVDDRVVSLDLRPTLLTGADLEPLKSLANLTELMLNQRQVAGSGVEHLKEMTDLARLDLSDTSIGNDGLEHLKGLTNLEALWLGHTLITDAGLIHLQGMSRLRSLGVNDTQITAAGLKQLQGLSSLEELSIPDTRVTDTGLEHLVALTQLNDLSLGNGKGNHPITDVGVAHLNRLEKLERLDIWYLTNAALERLKGLTRVKSLSIHGQQITDAGIPHLQELRHLKELGLYGTGITPAGLKKLREALPDCEITATEEVDED